MANQPKKYKKFVATAATATLVASAIVPVASAASLSDIAGNTHEEAINALVDAKVISGYPDGTFKPNKTLTRSDVVKLLGKYLETKGYEVPSDYKTNMRFSDLKTTSNEELLKYAALVADNGVFNGSNGKLLAGDNITRENMAIVLVRMVNTLKDISLEEYVDAQNFKGDVKDLNAAKAEARSAIEVLDFYDITNPAVANFNPKGDTTRGQFATFLYKTINTDFAGAAVTGKITAINATTVEVKFAEEVKDIKALDFAIEGLEVSNAVVKQSDKKTVVLTTSPQTAGVEYTVTVNGDKIGTFIGISAVIPTAVNIVEQSLQAPIGTQVTLKAQVTVKEGQSKAGIPVTFNIVNNYGDNNTGTLNQPIVAEAKTDENGVATYTYTRYAQTTYQLASHDEVQAYATGNPAARSFSKVYWANIQPLTLTEVTEGNAIQNGGKKVYKVKVATEHAETVTKTSYDANVAYYNAKGIFAPGKYVNVGFEENTNITPDKAVKTVDVIDASGKNLGYPGQYTTSVAGGNNLNNWVKEVKIQLDANGEAVFTLSGLDGAVTPYVFVDQKVNPANDQGTSGRFEATELFAKAQKVTFAKNHTLVTKIDAVGVQFAASFFNGLVDASGKHLNDHDGNFVKDNLSALLATKDSVANLNLYTKADIDNLFADAGGRDYKITVTDKNGKIAPKGTVVGVELAYGTSQRADGGAIYFYDKTNKQLQYVTQNASTGSKKTIWTQTDEKGEITFTLAGYKDAYVTPTAVIDSGDTKNEVDKNDQKIAGEIVYFADAKVNNAVLTTNKTTAKAGGTADGTEEIEFTYRTVDQNGKFYRPAVNNLNSHNPDTNNVPVTFELTTTFNPIKVKVGTSEETIQTFVGLGHNEVEVGPDSNGNYLNNPNNYRSLTVVANDKGVASIKVTAANGTDVNVLASASLASLPQLLKASVSFVNTQQVPNNYSGRVDTFNTDDKTLTFEGKSKVSYAGATYFYNNVPLNEEAFVALLKDAKGSVMVNRTVDTNGTKFTVLSVNNVDGKDPIEENSVSAVTKEQLKNAVQTEIDANLQKENYTEASWKKYDDALTHAKGTLTNNAATEATIEDAIKLLEEAKAGLVLVNPGQVELVKAIADAENAKLVKEDYTEASWTAYEAALKAAKEAAVSTTATDADKSAAAKALTKAVGALEKAPVASGDFTFTAQEAVVNKVIPQAATYNIAGTVAESVGEVAKVVVAFGTKEVEATYNETTRAFEFKQNSVTKDTVVVKAYDAAGKALATETIEIIKK